MAKLTIVASLTALLSGTALAHAQSFIAPGGEPAVTAPGGTEGRDGQRNVIDGIEDGEAVGVPPGSVDDYADERRVSRSRNRGLDDKD